MPTIDLDTVRHVANLARLHFSPQEEQKMAEELGSILGHIDVLNRLPAGDSYTAPQRPTPLREDRVTTERRPEDMLATAPDRLDTFIRVPAVLAGPSND